jgi:nucleoid DNA-binding protein
MEEQKMSKITIQEFAERLAERKGMSVSDAQRFLTAMLDTINDGLKDEKIVKVKGLGTFKVIDVKQRKSVDVNTGEEIIIEGRGKITFTPDSIMKDLVNKPFSQFETVVLNEGVDFSEIDSVSDVDIESSDVEDVVENEEEKDEIVEPQVDIVPPISRIVGNEMPETEPESMEEASSNAADYVSEESFSEALLVLDYINGKELPKETPAQEPEAESLDTTDEAIADALFVVHSLDEGTPEEVPVDDIEEPSADEEPEPVVEEKAEPVVEDIVEEEKQEEPVKEAAVDEEKHDE